MKYNSTPKYLGVTFDRALTFKYHLTNTPRKVQSRVNLVRKLAGTTWGADTSVLRTASHALVYSAAEYCSPVWLGSAHTDRFDTQPNVAMRTISGTIRSTPVHWLPVLSNIPPPHLRRKTALLNEWVKVSQNECVPLHTDLQSLPAKRLQSRKPAYEEAERLVESGFDQRAEWKREWREASPRNSHLPSSLAQRANAARLSGLQ